MSIYDVGTGALTAGSADSEPAAAIEKLLPH
jgi:hypothetical protein